MSQRAFRAPRRLSQQRQQWQEWQQLQQQGHQGPPPQPPPTPPTTTTPPTTPTPQQQQWRQHTSALVGAASVAAFAAVTVSGLSFLTGLVAASVSGLVTLKVQAGFSAREAIFALGFILVVGAGYLLLAQWLIHANDQAERTESNRHAESFLDDSILSKPGVTLMFKEKNGQKELLIEKRDGAAGSPPGPAGAAGSPPEPAAGEPPPITCTDASARATILQFAGQGALLDLQEARKLDEHLADLDELPCEWPSSSLDACFYQARPVGAQALDVKSAAAFLACRVDMLPSRECQILVCAE